MSLPSVTIQIHLTQCLAETSLLLTASTRLLRHEDYDSKAVSLETRSGRCALRSHPSCFRHAQLSKKLSLVEMSRVVSYPAKDTQAFILLPCPEGGKFLGKPIRQLEPFVLVHSSEGQSYLSLEIEADTSVAYLRTLTPAAQRFAFTTTEGRHSFLSSTCAYFLGLFPGGKILSPQENKLKLSSEHNPNSLWRISEYGSRPNNTIWPQAIPYELGSFSTRKH